MKNTIHELIVNAWIKTGFEIPGYHTIPTFTIEYTRDTRFGDFATNIAMLNAKLVGLAPRLIAQKIIDNLESPSWLDKVEIAGPGFINFYLKKMAWSHIVPKILVQNSNFGCTTMDQDTSVHLEFVSANPTGPLHVGHGRGAAYGSVVANLLKSQGYRVHCEYYVNDAGRQMDILATSVWLRYLELCGLSFRFPSNGYRGDYVWDIAAQLHRTQGTKFICSLAEVADKLPEDAPTAEECDADGTPFANAPAGDKEKYIDALIERAKSLLGADGYRQVFDLGLNLILTDIRDDLEKFGVHYQEWYSERSLSESGALQKILDRLQASPYSYYKDGALWFKSTEYGDEKDRVLVRENGQLTYFAADIAYHINKFERGFHHYINIWGADHHGYVPRVKAALSAFGKDADSLRVLLVQFAILYRNGERVQMSTRSGEFVTLRQLRKEVGNDAARFFYVMRKCEQHLDFDLDLATSQTNDNPVYYIQYAHARICAVLRQAIEKKWDYQQTSGTENLGFLIEDHEIILLKKLASYPAMLADAAENAEPHQLAQYLRDLAADFHGYYNAHQFLVEDEALRIARLSLLRACQIVFVNGLQLLGIRAPEQM